MNRQCPDSRTSLQAAVLIAKIPMVALAGVFLITSVAAQPAQKTTQHGRKRHSSTAKPKSPVPAPDSLTYAPAPQPEFPPPTPGQMPPKKPQVTWDGKQLTIISENSTLSDILSEVHTLTGAVLEMPPNSGRERVAAQLGPGPAREVLSSLLGGSEFDYVIQAPEGDPAALCSLLLTARGKGEGTVTRAGLEVVAENQRRSAFQNYPRTKPAIEDAPVLENTASAQSENTVEPSSPTGQAVASTAGASPATVPQSPVASVGSGEAQPGTTSSQGPVASAEVQPGATSSQTPGDAPNVVVDAESVAAPSAEIADSSANKAPVSEVQQRVQQMQNLYDQRKQMIEEAHKPPPAN